MKKSFPFVIAISIMTTGVIISFSTTNLLYIKIAITIGVFLLMFFAILKSVNKKNQYQIKNMPISKIGNLTKGFVKVKGKLYSNSHIKSKLTATDCIGYSYNAMKLIFKKEYGKSKKNRWKIIDSQIKCEDFYIFDSTGKIKVSTKNITIFTDLNYHKKEEKHITYTESLLLVDQQEYYIIGTVVKYKNNLVISNNDEQELIIASPNEYDIIFDTSKAYRIGCSIFLIILIIIFLWFLFGDL